jgi:hypothetical protein
MMDAMDVVDAMLLKAQFEVGIHRTFPLYVVLAKLTYHAYDTSYQDPDSKHWQVEGCYRSVYTPDVRSN